MSTATVTAKVENQNKTPQEMAKEIVKAAVEDKELTISGTTFQKLETVVKYLNRDKIQARSVAWFNSNFDRLVTDAVTLLIETREEQILKYLKKKEQDEKTSAMLDMVARGISAQDAYKACFGN